MNARTPETVVLEAVERYTEVQKDVHSKSIKSSVGVCVLGVVSRVRALVCAASIFTCVLLFLCVVLEPFDAMAKERAF